MTRISIEIDLTTLTRRQLLGGAGAASAATLLPWDRALAQTKLNVGYRTTPNTGKTGAFLNSGNEAPTSVNLSLDPGTYQFFIFGEPGLDKSHFGLNLFFDGSSSPGISVFAPMDTAPSPPFPAFTANSSPQTRNLANTAFVPGAGSLVYTSGLFTISLTDYRWSTPAVESLDRVQGHNNTPNGTNDYIGSFTLQATVVSPAGGRFSARLSCPATARANAPLTVEVVFGNPTGERVEVTRGALGIHAGGLQLTGPRAFEMSVPVLPVTTVPAQIPVLVPRTARPGSFVSLGFSFFGSMGGSASRQLLASDGCAIEIVR